MLQLISDPYTIEEKIGFNLKKGLLQTNQAHDRRIHLPLLLRENETKEYLVAREIEKNNLKANNCPLPVLLYKPYFFLDKQTEEKIPSCLSELLKDRFQAKEISVDYKIPYNLYKELAENFTVEIEGKINLKGSVFRTSCQDVKSRFYHNEEKIKEIALGLTDNMYKGDQLKALMIRDAEDNRFSLLNNMLDKEQLDGIIVCSPVAVMEVAGYPARGLNSPEIYAFYLKGDNYVYMLALNEESKVRMKEMGFEQLKLNNFVEMIKEERIGFEEDYQDILSCKEISKRCELKPFSESLRRWREAKMNMKDLPYFVITSRASKFAIENTISFAQENIIEKGQEITEEDLFEYYKKQLNTFHSEHSIPVPFEIYFTNLHIGKRSMHPANPTNYQISADSTNLKIDAGIIITDGPDLIHACSDLARSLTFTNEGKETYQILQEAILKGALPAVKDQNKSCEVYQACIDELSRFEAKLKNIGMLPDSFNVKKDYQRNIGHLLERQESFTFEFTVDDEAKLTKNMLGCVELQWPYKGYSIAFEETFVVTDDGAICLTR